MSSQLVRARCGILTLFALSILVRSGLAADEKPAELPLKRVVLFSSGVGFFEHNGQVTGDQTVEMKFKADDINDLLKSMVLRDLDGGQISTVSYDSHDPLTKTLKTFAIDLTRSPSLADLLRQIRGERVQVEAPSPISGVILGVERRRVPAGKDEVIETEILNLKTDTGLRSVPLQNIVEIRLLDERLNNELQQALAVLAKAHATDKKSVSLHFSGQGTRWVRVGYIQESPVWKTSYRLVLKEGEDPFLQGWAIIENTGDHDWEDVQMTLVSGRPVSFLMDLYQSLYVTRPTVVPESFAGLAPRTYGQDLQGKEAEFQELAAGQNPAVRRPRGGMGGGGGGGGAFGGGAFGGGLASAGEKLDLKQGVASAAQADDVGELFRYSITNPVSLPRQKSAMLPIVNDSVKGEKVGIYNEQVQAKHPMNGLRLTNSTPLHLMQGPITVFDGGEYAGDAQIEDIHPGSERLISYALDLDCEVAPETSAGDQELVSVKLVKGVLQTQHKTTRTKKFVVKNSGQKTKKLLVEVPREADWQLVEPAKPAELTRDLYRFAVTAEPGQPANLTVTAERATRADIAITALDDKLVGVFTSSNVVSPGVKQAIAEVVKRKLALGAVSAKRGQLVLQSKQIDDEQSRMRQNMAQLDHTSELYKRYVGKFATQEDEIERLRKELQATFDEEARLQKELDEYVAGLNVS